MKLVIVIFCSTILLVASEPKVKDAAATKTETKVSAASKLDSKVPDVISEESGYLVYGSGSKNYGGRSKGHEDYGYEQKQKGGRSKGKYPSSTIEEYGYEENSKGYGGRNSKGEYKGGYGYEENSKDSGRSKGQYGEYGYEISKNSGGQSKEEYPYLGIYGYEDNSKGDRKGEYGYEKNYRGIGDYGYEQNYKGIGDYGYEKNYKGIGDYGYEKNYKGIGEYGYEKNNKGGEYGKGDYEIPLMEELLYGYGGRQNYGGKNSDYKYRIYGREGLGFDKRTAYALGLRYPLTPKLLETVYRNTKYEDCYSCKL